MSQVASKKTRVALYLQDAHKISEGMEFCQYAEAKGFEAV